MLLWTSNDNQLMNKKNVKNEFHSMKLHAIGIELNWKKMGYKIITKEYWKFAYAYDVEKK